MTREEAIKWLTNEKWKNANNKYKKEWNEAFDMAIEALHREEAEEKGYCHRINYIPKPCEYANCDCVDVVRCKDCKWRIGIYCDHEDGMVSICDDDFCSCGERKNPENG